MEAAAEKEASGSRVHADDGQPTYAAAAGKPVAGGKQASAAAASSSSTAWTNMPRQRSRGQLARRHSITRGGDVRSATKPLRHAEQRDRDTSVESASSTAASNAARKATAAGRSTSANTRSGPGTSGEQPWLGGLYFTDIVFIAFTYSINLLRTLGLAELTDVIFKGLVYSITQLPIDLYRRWSLCNSMPTIDATSIAHGRRSAAKIRRRRRRRQAKQATVGTGSSSESDAFESFSTHPLLASQFSENAKSSESSYTIGHLSPFHHIVILLSRFASSNFPHLLPRVLFAEETIGPFVYWRTGGGSNAMVQEFTDLNERRTPLLKSTQEAYAKRNTSSATSTARHASSLPNDDGSFRAYLLSKDARLPIEIQRSNIASRQATTLLYLHGGGFSLGSVAFYAEALLRLRAKIALLESKGQSKRNHFVAEARCVAVEYDLSPTSRFPLPLLQCLRCYAHLIEVEQIDPESICISGDSAGGNLAMAMLLCLDGQMRDEPAISERDWSKLPMPGKAVLISPWVDLRPKEAFAFSDLRKQDRFKNTADKETESHETKDRTSDAKSSSPKSDGDALNAWIEAVSKYDWDFVASESLLHFAQLYTGVLPTPRRVHGPLGWIAHVCGVLAMQYDSESDELEDGDGSLPAGEETIRKVKGFMDPSRAWSVLSQPSRRLAKATFDALNDPLLARILGLSLDGGTGVEESQTRIVARSESLTAGFQPLFTPSDRRTDVVKNTSQLYEPVEGPLSSSGADKIGVDRDAVHTRLRARQLLDSHPLISPTVGDWSRIKLKHGCLVTWGERERMARDIEAWVDSVVNGSSDKRSDPSNIPPAQDGHSQTEHVLHQANDDGSDADEWIYTAVENGPGGVHAWPYVSMYLAGTESERERGLDMLARFVARDQTNEEDDLTEREDGAHSVEDEKRERVLSEVLQSLRDEDQQESVDLPHAAPYSSSEDDDGDSIGSMPSDVDLHGIVDSPIHKRVAGIDIVEAVRRAQELGYVETEVVEAAEEREKATEDRIAPEAEKKIPLNVTRSAPAPNLRNAIPSRPILSAPQQTRSPRKEPERGRSRSPRQIAHLVSPTTPTSPSDGSSSYFVSGVALHMPANVPHFSHAVQPRPVQQTQPRSSATAESQNAVPLWWTGANVGTQSTRQVEQDDKPHRHPRNQAQEELDAPLSIAMPTSQLVRSSEAQDSEAGTSKDADVLAVKVNDDKDDVDEEDYEEEEEEAVSSPDPIPPSRSQLEDIAEASSEEASSPIGSLSPVPASEILPSVAFESEEDESDDDDVEACERLARADTVNIDPGMYGLSHWAIRRPEPEGLSDIAEEGSVLSASITSAGDEDRSRSLSPVGVWRSAGATSGNTSLTEAATQFMQSQGGNVQRGQQATAPSDTPTQWRFLRDEIGIRRRDVNDEEEDEDDEEEDDMLVGNRAFSPPAKPQPGRSLPVVSQASGGRGSRSSSTHSDRSGASRARSNVDASAAAHSPSNAESDSDENHSGKEDAGSSSSGAIGIQRKKPKGDVWW